jgi:hypothetical protein
MNIYEKIDHKVVKLTEIVNLMNKINQKGGQLGGAKDLVKFKKNVISKYNNIYKDMKPLSQEIENYFNSLLEEDINALLVNYYNDYSKGKNIPELHKFNMNNTSYSEADENMIAYLLYNEGEQRIKKLAVLVPETQEEQTKNVPVPGAPLLDINSKTNKNLQKPISEFNKSEFGVYKLSACKPDDSTVSLIELAETIDNLIVNNNKNYDIYIDIIFRYRNIIIKRSEITNTLPNSEIENCEDTQKAVKQIKTVEDKISQLTDMINGVIVNIPTGTGTNVELMNNNYDIWIKKWGDSKMKTEEQIKELEEYINKIKINEPGKSDTFMENIKKDTQTGGAILNKFNKKVTNLTKILKIMKNQTGGTGEEIEIYKIPPYKMNHSDLKIMPTKFLCNEKIENEKLINLAKAIDSLINKNKARSKYFTTLTEKLRILVEQNNIYFDKFNKMLTAKVVTPNTVKTCKAKQDEYKRLSQELLNLTEYVKQHIPELLVMPEIKSPNK